MDTNNNSQNFNMGNSGGNSILNPAVMIKKNVMQLDITNSYTSGGLIN